MAANQGISIIGEIIRAAAAALPAAGQLRSRQPLRSKQLAKTLDFSTF